MLKLIRFQSAQFQSFPRYLFRYEKISQFLFISFSSNSNYFHNLDSRIFVITKIIIGLFTTSLRIACVHFLL